MVGPESEHSFYHACARAHVGSHESLAKLIEKHRTWERAWKKIAKDYRSIDAESEWKKLARTDIALILHGDPAYPPLLREIPHAPFGIYVRGTLPSTGRLTLAIVGTRNATEPGKELAESFAHALAREGAVIVSGLALGIDAAAHRGCLEAKGTTVAVVATGLDRFYPRENERLGARIVKEGGAVISEYPPGVPGLPHQFLERNRIVSGLSRGALVVEAPARSGSLATARFALEQNRDVFVVPGPALHPNFKGSHALIREGAELVTAPEDILAAYGIESNLIGGSPWAETDDARAVLACLAASKKPVSIDKIIEATNLKARMAMQALGFLAASGRVEERGGGYALRAHI